MPRLLVRFSKRGPLRFISHLDTLEALRRALRRAGLPVALSKGDPPQPRLSILHPLPVGTESLSEYLNVELRRAVPPDRFRNALARELPEGLEILHAQTTRRKFSYPRLEFTYRVALEEGTLPGEETIRDFLGRETVDLVRRRRGREQTENVRPYVLEILRAGDSLRMRVACVEGRSPRPEEILRLLCGSNGIRCRVLKLETSYGDR